jgi:hypothetical protein
LRHFQCSVCPRALVNIRAVSGKLGNRAPARASRIGRTGTCVRYCVACRSRAGQIPPSLAPLPRISSRPRSAARSLHPRAQPAARHANTLPMLARCTTALAAPLLTRCARAPLRRAPRSSSLSAAPRPCTPLAPRRRASVALSRSARLAVGLGHGPHRVKNSPPRAAGGGRIGRPI